MTVTQSRPAAGTGPPTRSRPRRLLAAALAAVLVAALVLSGVWWSGHRWQTVWSDGFDGEAGAPPSQDWIVDTGTQYPGGAPAWGTGEVQTYTDDPANLAQDGEGHLAITATRDAGGAWRSGRIETRRTDFMASPGGSLKVTARIKVPDGGQGYWAAFWMLGEGFRADPTDWPGAGEIDVLETIGREPSTVHGTLHCGTAPGGPCFESNGISGARSVPDGTPLSAAFHDYSVEWDRSGDVEELRWYLDGELFHTVHADDVPAAVWEQATHHGFFLLLNLAIGGGWPGNPDDTTRPGRTMLVDSVSVQRR